MNRLTKSCLQIFNVCFKMFAICLLLSVFTSTKIQAQDTGCYTLKNLITNEYLSNGGPLFFDYYANRGKADAWEKFYLTKLPDGKYTIYGEDGKYLSAQPWGGFVWKASTPNDWEKWNISGGIIESHHGTELMARPIFKNVMVVDRDNAEEDRAGTDSRTYYGLYNWTIEPSTGCKVPPTFYLNPPFTDDYLTINSTSDCVPIPQANNPIANLTVEAWVNNSSLGNDIQAIVSATDGSFVHLQTSADNNVNCVVYLDNGGAVMLPVIPALTANKWHHVAIVAESGNSRIYLDGKQVGAVNPTTFNGIKPSNSVFIGKGWEGQRIFKGKMAGVRVWDRAFTPAEIYANYTSIPTNLNGLIFQR
ncbi:MAG: LamG domain-containing protein [Chitinophagales bacterium]